jgi:mono/diheme cytochrome c family protein
MTGVSVLQRISNENYFDLNKKPLLNRQTPGKEIYNEFCIQCHGANGKRFKNFLLDADWFTVKEMKVSPRSSWTKRRNSRQ